MAQTYEFTPLAQVPAAEEVTEQDTVLVEQGGEIKRAPKNTVGGALVVELTVDINTFMTNETYVDETTLYDPIYEAFLAGRTVQFVVHTGELESLDGVTIPSFPVLMYGVGAVLHPEAGGLVVPIINPVGFNLQELIFTNGTYFQKIFGDIV